MALKKTVKFCTKCNEKLVAGAVFCSMCGTKVEEEKKCKECGTKLAKGAMFCHVCGVKYGEVQQSATNNDWEVKFSNDDSQFVFDTKATSIEFESSSVGVDGVKNTITEDCSNKPDLVAENALLSLCPDTECTHTREYYNSSNFEGTHFTRTLYNHRLYWITMGKYNEEGGVWCSKENGTEKKLVISKEQLSDSDWQYIVVNYYGVFLYRLEYATEDERVKHDSQIRWYSFDGVLKQELAIVGSNQCLSDMYIYGSKIFFSAYTGKVRRNYCVGYYDILTGEKNRFDTPKKEISKVLGNGECLMFQFDDMDVEDMWFVYPYKTGEQGECYSQIEYFDLKHNKVWVNDNKLIDVHDINGDSFKATTLIEHGLQGSNIIKLPNPIRWIYKREFGRRMEYFDGEHLYRGQEYMKFSSYNQDGEEYQWNAESKHGAYDKSIILGDYVYFDESNWIDQYKATHIQEPSIRRL